MKWEGFFEWKDYQSANYKTINILNCQNIPENDGAAFQTAHNFNCYQFGSSFQSVSDGISCSEEDPTQAPTCAVAAVPALPYRNYFVEIEPNRKGQIKEELNLWLQTPIQLTGGKTNTKESE